MCENLPRPHCTMANAWANWRGVNGASHVHPGSSMPADRTLWLMPDFNPVTLQHFSGDVKFRYEKFQRSKLSSNQRKHRPCFRRSVTPITITQLLNRNITSPQPSIFGRPALSRPWFEGSPRIISSALVAGSLAAEALKALNALRHCGMFASTGVVMCKVASVANGGTGVQS